MGTLERTNPLEGWSLNFRYNVLQPSRVCGFFRWSRDPKTGEILIDPVSKRNILEFVAIKRKDNGEWAIPGG
jgi:hypothetical protein